MHTPLPGLLLLATGGTIAGEAASPDRTQGYKPAAVPVERLLDAVPGIRQRAQVRAEQPYAIGSQHLASSHWLTLAARIRAAQSDPAIDGMVITHGTDTMEETAFFLDLVCARTKPLALTGAMRPSTALGADGPMNLYAAASVALDRRCAQAGPLVVMNDQIFTPDQACKAHTTRTDAFVAREGMPIGVMADGMPHWRQDPGGLAQTRPSLAAQLLDLPAHLPRVDILAQQVDVDVGIVDWMLSRGARGIVVAGTGHGSIADPLQGALQRAAAAGCIVVRASRVAAGAVHRGASVDDDAQGFVAAGFLPPHKARLLTTLALAAGLGRDAIQALFAQY